jgi:pimeloyl-ACP methyl ester carboxylesterase
MITATSEDGAVIATYDFGGSGEPLLLAHATGFHAHAWLPVVAHLDHRFHCYAFDARAHGASPTPPSGDFGWRRFGDDARAAAAALGLHRPRAAGHSAGGGLLLAAEEDHPGSWAAIWAYEPVVFPPGPALPNPLAASTRRRKGWFVSRQAALDNFSGKLPFKAFSPEALHAYVDHGFVDCDDGGVTLACRPEDEAATYEQAARSGIWEGLPGVGIPVHGVRGSTSDHPPAPLLDRVVARLPAGTIETMDGLGHFGPMEDPARVAASITAALG